MVVARSFTDRLPLLLTYTLFSRRCDSIPAMKASLVKLKDKLGSNPEYFQKVYNHTFDFAKLEGQRSIGTALRIYVYFELRPYLRIED